MKGSKGCSSSTAPQTEFQAGDYDGGDALVVQHLNAAQGVFLIANCLPRESLQLKAVWGDNIGVWNNVVAEHGDKTVRDI